MKASKGLALIYVDCTVQGAHKATSEKFGVRGYPTVVFLDGEGKDVGRLQTHSPAGVAQQFGDLVKNHSKRPDWAESLDAGIARAKEASKPVLVFVADPREGVSQVSNVVESFFLHDESKDAATPFVLVRIEYEKGDELCKKLGAKKGPALYVLDPAAEDPADKPVVKVGTVKSPKSFKKELESALEKYQKAQERKQA